MSKVIKAIHETVVNGKMPSKAIASAIGKPYTTLMRETNPYDPGAKLGVETFMAIIETTGDPTPDRSNSWCRNSATCFSPESSRAWQVRHGRPMLKSNEN